MRHNKQKIFRDLCILRGVFPDNGGSNICAGDGYYAQSLVREYGMSISELEKLVNFDKYVKTLAKAQEIVHTSFIDNMKKGN